MAANMELAKQQGLSTQAIMRIDTLHDALDAFIASLTLDHDEHDARAYVRDIEYDLQELWGFDQNSRYHTWVHKVSRRFRELQYLGVVYLCKDSHETRTIGRQELECGVLVGVGRGFIDFGGVVRIVGNLERVV